MNCQLTGDGAYIIHTYDNERIDGHSTGHSFWGLRELKDAVDQARAAKDPGMHPPTHGVIDLPVRHVPPPEEHIRFIDRLLVQAMGGFLKGCGMGD